ncbi:MAG: biotin/lipoyl-binding protein [Planctomycetota bacterium]
MEWTRRIILAVTSVLCLIGGAAVMYGLVQTRPVAPTHVQTPLVPEVQVSAARYGEANSPVVGFGTVRPKHQVNIIPQVSGKLTQVNKDLAVGKVIPRGDLLFEIDPTIYESRVRQGEAEVRALGAAGRRHDQQAGDLKERIANAEQMLSIDEADLSASENLFRNDHVGTQREVDVVRQKSLRQKDALVELRSALAMLPHAREETAAQLEAAQARLRQMSYELENTKILSPFRARVEAVQANASQVVTAFFSIATISDAEFFELSVGVDPIDLQWLREDIRPQALETGDGNEEAADTRVVWSLSDRQLEWRGRVTRFERVDESTRTARMVIEVKDGERSPFDRNTVMGAGLSVGMYCRVELPAQPLNAALLIPRRALHNEQWVYVVRPDDVASSSGAEGRLEQRRVTVLRTIGEEVLVDHRGRDGQSVCELLEGDRIVVSPIARPVAGMKVRWRQTDGPSSLTRMDNVISRSLALLTHDLTSFDPSGSSASINPLKRIDESR